MIRKVAQIMAQLRKMDRALLFIRVFVGMMLLVHIGWKIKDFDFLIEGYPALLFNSPVASFFIFTTIEAICMLMFILGLWVRFAAFIMLLGIIVDIAMLYGVVGWFGVEMQVLYGGIYICLLFSGAGKYSLDYHFGQSDENV
ncbi:MAG: DoxX family protein [Alistipes sp.]|nr:DoxX family protein [Alistipes sp.]